MQAFLGSREETRFTKYRLGKLPELPAEGGGGGEQADEPALPNRRAKPFLLGEGTTHGFYAHSQPPEAVAAVLRENIQGIEEQIVGVRMLGRGLLERQAQTTDSQEAAQLSDSYSKAAYRLAELIRTEGALTRQGKPRLPVEEILEQLDRVAAPLGKPPVADEIRAEALGGSPELAVADRQLAEEIASLRYVLRNTFRLATESREGREYMRLVEIYGSGCVRLMGMLRSEAGGGDRVEAYLRDMIDKAIEEAARRLGVSL